MQSGSRNDDPKPLTQSSKLKTEEKKKDFLSLKRLLKSAKYLAISVEILSGSMLAIISTVSLCCTKVQVTDHSFSRENKNKTPYVQDLCL